MAARQAMEHFHLYTATPSAGGALGVVHAVLVTFNSRPEVFQSIRAIVPQVQQLVIVDNGSGPALVAALDLFAQEHGPKIEVIKNAENLGLAAAQNQGIRVALAANADWILLLDDDSVPHPNFIARFDRALSSAGESSSFAMMGAAVHQPAEAGETRYWTMKNPWRVRRVRLGNRPEENALFAIASGSLIRRRTLESLGLMREEFFIDYIDVEFGLRVRRAGSRIIIVPDAVLDHRLGAPTRHKLAGFLFKTTNHDHFRRFSIFQNRVRVWRSYWSAFPGWVFTDIAAAAFDLIRIVCFENNKCSKLCGAVRGAFYGLQMPPLDSHGGS